jgi:poly-gamma-glutamate synthesis protein (capsule biosynthesis protein)
MKKMLCAAALVVAVVSAQPAPIAIVLAGQAMIRSDLRATKPEAVAAARGLLGRGDVIFTNFEGAVAMPGESAGEGRGFLAPPGALDALRAMGFNLLALADNHAYDLKETGISNTLRELRRRNIPHAGTGADMADASAPVYFKTPKGTTALVASASGLIAAGGRAAPVHPGVNQLRVVAGDRENDATADLPDGPANTPDEEDARRILDSIREARRQADVVIVYQHNHVFANHSFSTIFTEGLPERLAPDPWLVNWTHDEIDAGADIIVMHGAPLVHGVEIYRGRPIFYDLGNFIYNVPPTLTYIDEPMAWESAIATVEFQPGAPQPIRSITLKPVVLNPLGDGQPDVHDPRASNEFLHTRGLPSPATGARAGYILQRMADASKPFGTTVTVSGDVATIAVADR